MYWRRPLTRLELALYVSLIGIFIAVFVERALYYMELAERTSMEVTVSRVNSAINMRRAFDILREGRASQPNGENPFEFARLTPPNFRGEVLAAEVYRLEKGNWAFDPLRGEVLYLPRLHRLLEVNDPDGAIRFRVRPEHGFTLVPTSEYKWEG
jgi:hypothetical protein